MLHELESREVKLLIVDTLASINPLDESISVARLIAEGFATFVMAGITCVILHHIGKSFVDNKGQKVARTGIDAARGSSALVAAVGSAFNLMYGHDDSRTLECVKPRYGRIPSIELVYDEHGAMGFPDWKITLSTPRVRVSQENLTHFIRAHNLQNVSSRKLVEILSDRGLSASQSTANRALSEFSKTTII